MQWPTIDDVLRAAERATLLGLGMAIGAAIDSELSTENWLYRWSTLLAGILAVGAAFITVRAMMHTDVRQQRRHDELMKLNLRAERLIANRAAKPWPSQLRTIGNRFQRALGMMSNLPDTTANRNAILRIVQEAVADTITILEGPPIVEAKALLDAIPFHRMMIVRAEGERLQRLVNDFARTSMDPERSEQNRRDLSGLLVQFKLDNDMIADHLEELARSYD